MSRRETATGESLRDPAAGGAGKVRRRAFRLLALLLVAVPSWAGGGALVVGLVPAESAEVTASLAAGARLAFEQARARGGPAVELVVGQSAGTWATASAAIVELAHRRRALALITPPDRATAHLMAQIGTRSQIPVIATSCAASVTATGSWWVVSVVEPCTAAAATPPRAPSLAGAEGFAAAFRDRFGSEPDGWALAGYDAAAVVGEAMRRGGGDRRRLAAVLGQAFAAPGAAGPIRFTERGARRASGSPLTSASVSRSH